MDEVFEVAPGPRRAMILRAVLYIAVAAGALWLWLQGGSALWLGLTGLAGGMALSTLITLMRRRYVARIDDKGVTVCLNWGREMHAGWDGIEAHTIDPARRIGTLLVRAGKGGRVRLLPVSSGMMGREATERFLARLKERLPGLEYRVPRLGAGGGAGSAPGPVGKTGITTGVKAGKAANKNSGRKG